MEHTKNPHAEIDVEASTVRRTIDIRAPREQVWRTVTEPALVSQWFGELSLTGAGVGAHGTIRWPNEAGIPIRVDAFEPPSMVSYRWNSEDAPPSEQLDEERSTLFTFTLVEVAGGTRLTVVETGFERAADPMANMADHRGGWDGELDKLVALLEREA